MILYLITCVPTNKRYVGITSKSLLARWKNHVSCARSTSKRSGRSLLHESIRKHGEDMFIVEEIQRTETYEQLLTLEQEYILKLGTLIPNGLNLTKGGQGCLGTKRTSETLQRMSIARIGKPVSAQTLASIRASKTPEVIAKIAKSCTGKKRSLEARRAMSEANKNSPFYQANIERLASLHRGRKQSPEEVQKRISAMRNSDKFKTAMKNRAKNNETQQ